MSAIVYGPSPCAATSCRCSASATATRCSFDFGATSTAAASAMNAGSSSRGMVPARPGASRREKAACSAVGAGTPPLACAHNKTETTRTAMLPSSRPAYENLELNAARPRRKQAELEERDGERVRQARPLSRASRARTAARGARRRTPQSKESITRWRLTCPPGASPVESRGRLLDWSQERLCFPARQRFAPTLQSSRPSDERRLS